MRHLKAGRLGACAVTVATIFGAAAASAGTLHFAGDPSTSNSGLGAFTGSMTYNAALGELTVTLKNTTAAATGGEIRGFGFNVNSATTPGAGNTSLTSSTKATFQTLLFNAQGDGLGKYDVAVVTSGSFNGSPGAGGLSVGETGTWVFDFTGLIDHGSRTVEDFWQLSSTPPGTPRHFLVRMMAMNNNGSDWVWGTLTLTAIPLPPALGWGFAGLIGVAAVGRRRRVA